MELPAGLKPRHIAGMLGMIIVGALMFNGTVSETLGITVIIGVLAALGAYSFKARQSK